LDYVAEILQKTTRFSTAGLDRTSEFRSELYVTCENFETALVFHATQKRVVSVFFLFLLFSLSRSPAETRTAILPCGAVFFSFSNTVFRLRDIDSPLLNSIRHDTWLFLEAFRHRDRLDECGRVGTAIVQKSCYSGSNAICVCVPLYARRTSLVPDGKNTVAHDTSLDRYPVWRIRSFIGIDIFAVAWSVYFSRTHFYLLDIIMRFTVLRYSWHSLEFNTFQLLKKYSSQLIPRSKKVLMLNLQN